MLFFGLIVLAGIITALGWKTRFIVFSLAAAVSWLVLGILCWTSPDTIGIDAISEPWAQALGLLFILMTIGPLLLQMRTDIQHEARGYGDNEVIRWSDSGGNPGKRKTTQRQRSQQNQKDYRKALRRTIGRRR